jgi:hypothetical protein
MRFVSSAGLALVLSYASVAVGQTVAKPSPRFGLIGGINLATLSGSDAEGLENRTGFMGGLLFSIPITKDFAIQPEAIFTMKGAEAKSTEASAAAKRRYRPSTRESGYRRAQSCAR